MTARYISTSPALSKAAPMISVNQCTPETSLPVTMKAIKAATVEELSEAPGMNISAAKSLREFLDNEE